MKRASGVSVVGRVRGRGVRASWSSDDAWCVVHEPVREDLHRFYAFEASTGREAFRKEFTGQITNVFWQGTETFWITHRETSEQPFALHALAIPDGGIGRSFVPIALQAERLQLLPLDEHRFLAYRFYGPSTALKVELSCGRFDNEQCLWTTAVRAWEPTRSDWEYPLLSAVHPDRERALFYVGVGQFFEVSLQTGACERRFALDSNRRGSRVTYSNPDELLQLRQILGVNWTYELARLSLDAPFHPRLQPIVYSEGLVSDSSSGIYAFDSALGDEWYLSARFPDRTQLWWLTKSSDALHTHIVKGPWDVNLFADDGLLLQCSSRERLLLARWKRGELNVLFPRRVMLPKIDGAHTASASPKGSFLSIHTSGPVREPPRKYEQVLWMRSEELFEHTKPEQLTLDLR